MYQTAKVDTQSAYLGTNRADSIKTIGLMCYTYGEQPRKAGKATAKAMS